MTADQSAGTPLARYDIDSAAEMNTLGIALAGALRAGDLVLLIGPLGAGKTTLARGIGAGLGVRGEVTSPTFVIARVHPSLGDGPSMVHADLYRLGGVLELDDLDLDADVVDSVTVVEWGEGMAEALATDRLEISLSRGIEDENRGVVIVAVGSRWDGVDLSTLSSSAAETNA